MVGPLVVVGGVQAQVVVQGGCAVFGESYGPPAGMAGEASAVAQGGEQEYGRLVRTIYLCRSVANEELRRRVRRQLNKGESLHALRRDLFFAHQGHVRRRHLDDQVDQALCLTLVTNAAVLRTTTYLGDALDALRDDGYPVTDEAAAHLTPAQHDHITTSSAATNSASPISATGNSDRYATPPQPRSDQVTAC